MDTSNRKLRMCVIGAGQAGMAALYYFAKLGASSPEVTCYERGATWGGQWNCTWRTDTDQYGERIRTGMYRTMWINGPKETNELPHYTFDQHFGKNIPSFFTAPVMLQYLDGYWRSSTVDLSQMIRFNTVVTSVCYNDDTDDFTVVTTDLVGRRSNKPETFSHVIVASGQYIFPHAPDFKGFDTFPGRILHSQQFRGAHDFEGRRILIIGSNMSAEDIASQSYKYGAKHVLIAWKHHPLGYKFPKGVEERPLLQEMNGSLAKFKDGSTAEIDIIVHCTGYNMAFPYLEERLKLMEQKAVFFPWKLYKGVVWLGADKIQPGLYEDSDTVQSYLSTMRHKFHPDDPNQFNLMKASMDYFQDIVDDVGHPFKATEIGEIFCHSFAYRAYSTLDFRDLQYTSPNTGVKATPLHTKWIGNFDFNIDDYTTTT